MPKPLLLEINTRCWLREISGALGCPITLGNVPDTEFDSWQLLGFTHIWLMGVWTSGPRARAQALADPQQRSAFSAALPDWREEDVVGSPYAVAEYLVSAELGGEAGLREFRRKLNSHGLKLLLDFVPNHFGLDAPWLLTHPEYFVRAPSEARGFFAQTTASGPAWLAHGKDPNFLPWHDTAQLDYRKPATRAAMTRLLQNISNRCDGVRCDMAMLVLNEVFARTWSKTPLADRTPDSEFWEGAIAAVKRSKPEFLFLAEAYWGLEPRLQELGFDYTYDKRLYDVLLTGQASEVQSYLVGAGWKTLASGAHFLENHDEPRIARLADWAKHRAALLVILALPGMRFLHDGQLTGARRRVPVQLGRRLTEPVDPQVQKGYEQMLAALKSGVMGQGDGRMLVPRSAWEGTPTDRNFVLIQWQDSGKPFQLAAINYAPYRGQCFAPVQLPDGVRGEWRVEDLLSEEGYVRPTEDLRARGFYLDLEPFGTHVFAFEPTG